jgi:transposase-like protein
MGDMAIKLSCTNCRYKWSVLTEDKIPRRCPYCDKETVDWQVGEAGFTDIKDFLN